MPDTAADFSIWDAVEMAPADAILGIAQNFKDCKNPAKVNVCVGAYRDEDGKPWVLPSVRQAEAILAQEGDVKEYLSMRGDPAFLDAALRFAYGADVDLSQLAAVQTLSGTGACRIGGHFLAQAYPGHSIYLPSPTWGNHHKIFQRCGLDVQTYRYYDRSTNALDWDGLCADLKAAPAGSIVLFHACAHNPTGCDPTPEQWKTLWDTIVVPQKHVVFFDSAYQGFASGDPEADAQTLRMAMSSGSAVPLLLAQSFAKNFGLYGERVGTLSVRCRNTEQRDKIVSQLQAIVRPMYSSPPRHGSSIVKTVLADPARAAQYRQECAHMAARIHSMRTRLVQALAEAGSTHDWSHVLQQIGMFAFTGLSPDMCKELTREHSIFLTTNGRISVAGLNESNVEYVAKAIHQVTDGKSITTDAEPPAKL